MLIYFFDFVFQSLVSVFQCLLPQKFCLFGFATPDHVDKFTLFKLGQRDIGHNNTYSSDINIRQFATLTLMSRAIGIPLPPTVQYTGVKQHRPWFCTWMGDRSNVSNSADSSSDETLNQGPMALLLWRQYEFPSGINIVQFSIDIVQ